MAQGFTNDTPGLTYPVAVALGGTGQTSSTGSGVLVLNTAPTLNQPLIMGVTNGSSATAGQDGEYIVSQVLSSAPITLTSIGVPQNVTSITLTAGRWMVWGNIAITNGITGGAMNFVLGTINSTSATLPDSSMSSQGSLYPNSYFETFNSTIVPRQINVSSTTTFYLIAYANWVTGPTTVYGFIAGERR